jgi:GT2 family glycosyltransferase
MKLTSIAFPSIKEDTDSLYFHSTPFGDSFQHKMKQGDVFSTDTYFNIFSWNKYRKYTSLNQFKLTICAEGAFIFRLYTQSVCTKEIVQLSEQYLVFATKSSQSFSIDPAQLSDDSMVFFSLEACREGGVFYGGYYHGNVPQRSLKVAIVICTYKREMQVNRTLSNLDRFMMGNEQSEIRNQLEVFVIDNGKTLDLKSRSAIKVRCLSNRNLGGSGGFTRGMIEAYRRKEEFTHILLMDDDITLDPHVLFKTIQFLKIVRPEFEQICVAGSNLYDEKPFFQYEAGAKWDWKNLCIRPVKADYDLSQVKTLLENEKVDDLDFAGWGFFCFPIRYVQKDNFPFPFFIRMDDVEYAIRNQMHCVTMNGIGFWHPSPEHERYSSLDYYALRNSLVLSACHGGSPHFNKLKFEKRYFVQVIYGHYEIADCLLQAVLDYLKGIDFFKRVDGEENHKKITGILKKGNEFQKHSVSDQVRLTCQALVKRDFWRYVLYYIRVYLLFIRTHKQIDQEYRSNFRSLCDIETWNYLLKETQHEKV